MKELKIVIKTIIYFILFISIMFLYSGLELRKYGYYILMISLLLLTFIDLKEKINKKLTIYPLPTILVSVFVLHRITKISTEIVSSKYLDFGLEPKYFIPYWFIVSILLFFNFCLFNYKDKRKFNDNLLDS